MFNVFALRGSNPPDGGALCCFEQDLLLLRTRLLVVFSCETKLRTRATTPQVGGRAADAMTVIGTDGRGEPKLAGASAVCGKWKGALAMRLQQSQYALHCSTVRQTSDGFAVGLRLGLGFSGQGQGHGQGLPDEITKRSLLAFNEVIFKGTCMHGAPGAAGQAGPPCERDGTEDFSARRRPMFFLLPMIVCGKGIPWLVFAAACHLNGMGEDPDAFYVGREWDKKSSFQGRKHDFFFVF